MALFSKKPDPAVKSQRDLEAKLAAKRVSRDDLDQRRGIAETGAASHREKAIHLASDGGDDRALSAAETAMRREQDRVATLTDAITTIDASIADLESDIAQLVDQRCRAETAAATTLVEKWSSSMAAFSAAIGRLVDVARESAVIIVDAHPLQVFLEAVQQQVPPEADLVVSVLQGHASAVLVGTAAASLPKLPTPEPAKVIERPVTVRMFRMRTVRWLDAHGVQQTADQYTDVDRAPHGNPVLAAANFEVKTGPEIKGVIPMQARV
jgi:hypothetical protein